MPKEENIKLQPANHRTTTWFDGRITIFFVKLELDDQLMAHS